MYRGIAGGGPLPAGVIYRRLLGYCAPHWPVFLVAAAGMVIYAATDTGFAFLVNRLIEAVGPGEVDAGQVTLRKWLPLGILLLFFVRGAAEFCSTYSLGWIGRQVIKQLRRKVYLRFLDLPTSYFDRVSGGMLLSRLTFNVEQIAESTSNAGTFGT